VALLAALMDDIPISRPARPAALEGGTPRAPSEGQGRERRRPRAGAPKPSKGTPSPRPGARGRAEPDDDGPHIDILI
jgi:hypothetical protein